VFPVTRHDIRNQVSRRLFGMVARHELSAAQARAVLDVLSDRAGQGATPLPAPAGKIAIIGMAGRFPGADGIDAFWRLLADGRCAIGPKPSARWPAAARAAGAAPAGGWLDDIHSFDHAFFGIPRREAEVMDPQQALFLEAAWSALEHAGYAERDLTGRRVGVFVGAGAGDYANHLMALGAEPDGLSFMGNSNAILAARIAYILNLRGPCLTIDTACSSSLTAIHLACESLHAGGCEMAIVGGVCVLPTATFTQAASRAGMLSPSGLCRAFDAAADGFVPGEAVAAVVVKPLDRALADGDHVWGVVEGSAVNQDGRTHGITAPSAPSQAALIEDVHGRFGIDPAAISYVEAHGTGTRLGDPIEVEALTRAFRRHTREIGFCAIGSVKSAVGHTMSAAGAVSIIKVLLAFAHRLVPPSLHVTEPNPACEFASSPFFVNTAPLPWEARGGVRRAAISAFGFSGSNAHVVLAEPPATARPPADARPRLALLSARSKAALARRGADLAAAIEAGGDALDLDALCWTLAAGRSHHRERAVLLGATAADIVRGARVVAAGDVPALDNADVALRDIAGRYLAGEAVDPEALVPATARRRLPLPTYPFERVSCALRPATRPRPQRGLHPLLDAWLPGTPPGFGTTIEPGEAWLADHLVQDRAILPGACIAAMALAAAQLMRGQAPAGLADLAFHGPVDTAAAAGLQIRLDDDGFVLRGAPSHDRPLATGRLLWSHAGSPGDIDLPAVRARLATALSGDELAARFAAAGVVLGPLFRGIRRLWLGSHDALAELSLPGEELAGADAYCLHPTLLDGALQAGMAAFAAAHPEAREILVPAGLRTLALHAPAVATCLAHVTFPADVTPHVARFDVRLLDEKGRALAELQSVTAMRLGGTAAVASPAATAPAASAPAAVPLFAPIWRDVGPLAAPGPRPEGVVLVVREERDGGLGAAIGDALGDRFVLQVVLGETTASRGVGLFEVDRNDETAFDQLLATLKPLGAVYVLGGTEPVLPETAALECMAEKIILPRLRLLQALARQADHAAAAQHLPILVVTTAAHAVRAGEVPHVGSAALAGLSLGAARELAPLRLATVDLAPAELAADPARLAAALLAEVPEAPGRVVAYRDGRRWQRVLAKRMAPPAGASGFRDGGSYVIVGGTGGLGLALARHLARRHRANLLLVSRSPLSASQRRAIADIEAAGGQVVHARADATDPEQLSAALAIGRERFGRLDGAVQAAMVLHDTPFGRLDRRTVTSVLSPKLAATANLANALAPTAPDLLVIFSSANAFVGNPGQANYAAAAAGQDALGLALRAAGLPVTVINWGYWGEVGAVAAPVFLERAARLGIGAISVDEGMAALDAIMRSGESQLMAMKVTAERLCDLGLPAEPAAVTSAATSVAPVESAADAVAALSADFDAMEQTARDRLVGMFQRAGFLRAPGQTMPLAELRQKLALQPRYERLLDAVLDIMERAGLLLRRADRLEVTDAVLDPALAERVADPAAAEAALEARAAWLAPFLAVTRRCLGAYADVLSGRSTATELLFPHGSDALVAPLYRDNPIADYFNGAVVARVLETAKRRPTPEPLAITEVGAGTGGTAVAVMSAMAAAGIAFRYRFTDLSPGLVRAARQALGARFPATEFGVLDLEKPLKPADQGTADIVIATNVLHATADVAVAAECCRGLLRSGGSLILTEAVRRRDFATLVFGLTDGWWRFVDPGQRLPHSPLLDEARWRAVLSRAGFAPIALLPGTGSDAAQAVLVATAAVAGKAEAIGDIGGASIATPAAAVSGSAEGALDVARAAVVRALAEALRVAVDSIDEATGFAAQGVDSIIGVDLTERLGRLLRVSVPATALFDHPTPKALAAHLAAEHATHLAPRTRPPASEQVVVSAPRGAEGAPVPIAVVGMAGQWPGAADLAGFWRNLRDGAASIGGPPPGRWPGGAAQLPPEGAWRRGGFLDSVDYFDPLFFEMSGAEADHTDPQARLFLTTAWHALEHAGYGPAWLDGRRCGVFVGVAAGDYPSGAMPGAVPPPHAFMGNAQSVLAGRLAYLLNLRGPTLAVDTACSSSLVALHLACRAIADGDCSMALAGGVFVTSTPSFHYLAASLGMTSPSGATRAFDDGADGFVPAEGVGVVVLRRLDEALADGDHVLGVIRASGTNSDGRTHGMTAPSARAQADLLTEVLGRARLSAQEIDYVEAHGTGTALGDPIEVEALSRAMKGPRAAVGPCRIGSVKTNIGHAGPAAGIAGLQKVLLSLANEALPPSLNFVVPNRHIDFAAAPVAVCDRLTPWPHCADRPRRAGVSAFGLSGTNAHVIVEEAPVAPPRPALPAGPFLFVLSARTEAALGRRASDLADWLDGLGAAVPLADIAFTLAVGRRHMSHRRAFVAADLADLRHALRAPGAAARVTPVGASELAAAMAAGRTAVLGKTRDAGPLEILARAYAGGADVDWLALYDGAGLRRAVLPGYPFAEERHWVATTQAVPIAASAPVRVYAPVWRPVPAPSLPPPATLTLFDDGEDLANALAARLPIARRRYDALDRPGDIPASSRLIVLRPDITARGIEATARLLRYARDCLAKGRRAHVLLVLEGEGTDAEAVAATAALHAALAPRLEWTVLRLAAGVASTEIAEAVLTAGTAPAAGGEVRWRDGRCMARHLGPSVLPSGGATLPAGAVCWIVGGSGAIGVKLAAHLLARHGAGVILSARRGSDAALPAQAEILPLDVTDRAAVDRAAATIRAQYGRLDAVFHLAGAMRQAPLTAATDADLDRVLGAKMIGAVNLDGATAADRLAAFVLFSSLAAELGDFGQGDYAVANRFLAGFAAARAAAVARGERHGRSVSLGWPLWQDGGMAPAGADRDVALRASGLAAVSDAEGLAAFDALLGVDGHVAIVPAGGTDPFAAQHDVVRPRGESATAPPLALRRAVRDTLAAELRINAGEIADDAPFGSLGLDSLHMRSFADAVTSRFGVPLAPTDLFSANTVAALAAHLERQGAGRHPAASTAPATTLAKPSAAAPAAPAPPVAHVDARAAEPIAIIGMAARLPGAPDLDAFWDALIAGRDLVTEIPPTRWDWRAHGDAPGLAPDATVPRWGGFIDDVDRFDAGFFGMSPREAAFLDPQMRLLLEVTWHALENAAVPPATLAGRPVAVFVGSQLNDYAELIGDAGEAAAQAVLGNTHTMLANRISYLLDLRGPSQVVDTACSSALVALHRAVRALREGACELALAGGVHLILSPRAHKLGAQLGMLSPTGRCRTFDAEADGYVRGEGVGVAVLKPLSRAIADGDPIRAVILESGENHGGRASGLTTPNPEAQASLIADVLLRSGVEVASIGHVEAHGTGTSLGDPIEVKALRFAFQEAATARGEILPDGPFCRLSSVKSNIGHLEPASGIAGLAKSVLALEHAELPPTLHVTRPNPLLPLAQGPFRLLTRAEPWPQHPSGAPRRAGVSSFGLGGSNAYVLLQEWRPDARAAAPGDAVGTLVPLSARDAPALRRQARQLVDWLEAAPRDDWAWPDIVATLRVGRETMPARLVVEAASSDELAQRLSAWLTDGRMEGIFVGSATRDGLAAVFETPSESRALVIAAVTERRLDRVAALWVAGVPIDWSVVPAPAGGRRRALAGYPFARDRHWFDDRSTPASGAQAVAPVPLARMAEPPIRPAAVGTDADVIRDRLSALIGEALYLDTSPDPDTSLVELGVDSILAVEIARKLQDAFGVVLPATRLYDAPTIRRLAALIAELPGRTRASRSAEPEARLPIAAAAGPQERPAPETKAAAAVQRVRILVAETLYLSPDAIDVDQPFTDMGLDSILVVELARRIEREFGVALRATRLYDQPTPRRLGNALAAEIDATADAPATGAAPTPMPATHLAATSQAGEATPPAFAVLRDCLAELLSLAPEEIGTDLDLIEVGLDRVAAAELLRRIESRTGVRLDEAALYRADDLASLAATIQARQVVSAARVGAELAAPPARAAGAAETPEAIAVIGMAGRFPGAPDLDAFWRNLRDGVDSVTEVPASRFPIDRWYDPDPAVENRTYCRDGGFLTGIEDFDAAFFRISPHEARLMDPQQRLFLETAWHALEDAGLSEHALDGVACAVYVGCAQGDYAHRASARMSAHFGMGNVGSILAARIAYHLNLRGPAIAVDTACSSSLVAVHLACQALRAGECDMAVAGGVALMTTPSMHLLTSHARMLSRSGRCRTFDAAADGFVPAEGVGAVVLKPLARAIADGDHIHGVIEASGVNQDGRSNGMTAPSLAAQRELQLAVWERFGIAPDTLGHVEAHGTGTSLGDPVEMQALTDAFRRHSAAVGCCAISSVKTNIGHAVPAAGIAGLLKTLLLLRHRTIVASLHLRSVNPLIDLPTSPFRVPVAAAAWPAPAGGGPRRGAVNAFGFSGTNAHVVVAEPPPAAAGAPSAGPWLFLLSGRTKTALRERAASLRAWLAGYDGDYASVAATLAAGRSHFRVRAAIVAGTAQELDAALAGVAEGLRASDRPDLPAADAEVAGLAELARARDADARRAALERLALAYQAGARLSALYPRGGHVLSLPGYPFQRQRCWVDDADAAAVAAPCRSTGENAWHLAADDPLLAQHVVQGRQLLPAAASLAMLLQAAGDGADGPAVVTGIRWLRPALADGAGLALRMQADGDDAHSLVLWAGAERHASGRVEPVASEASPGAVDLATLRRRCGEAVDGASVYARLAALGLQYGPAYRCLDTLYRSADGSEALATLVPPAVPDPAPFLIDAALHSIAGVVEAHGDRSAAPLPSRLARARRAGRLADIRHAWLRARADEAAFDVTLTDAVGRVLLALEGFAAAPRRDPAGPRPSTLDYFQPCWEPMPAPIGEIVRADLVLIAGAGVEDLARKLATVDAVPCPIAALADQPADGLLAALPDGAHVVLLGGRRTTAAELSAALLVLAAAADARRAARITVVSCAATDAGSDRPANWRGAALLGLAKVAMREAPHLAVAALDIGANEADLAATPTAILREPVQRPQPLAAPDDIAWHGGVRLRRLLRPIPAPAPAASAIRQGGIYVIIGGTGGIGAALARRLAAQHRARLVLVGRSEPTAEVAALCTELTALGGEAVYESADCADLGAMRAVRDRALARFGAIHGVVHSAFVLADQLLAGMTASALMEAMRPKADGTAVLAEVFGALDFLALFSSTNAFTANAGQANYVAASMAQDMAGVWYGAEGVPIRRINWGFWGETGRVANPRYLKALSGTGVAPIETEDGLDALLAILAAGMTDVAVLRLATGQPASAPPVARAASAHPEASATAKDTIQGRLGAIIAEALYLGAPPDPDSNLVELGFDSILAVDVAHKLEQVFGVTLPPARIFEAPTVGDLAALIAGMGAAAPRSGERGPEAAALPPEPSGPSIATANVMERLGAVVAEALRLEPAAIDPDEPFTEIGVDSIIAVDMARSIEREFGVALPATWALDAPTPRRLAETVARQLAAPAVPPGAAEAIPIQRAGSGAAGFWVPSFIGEDGWIRHLAGMLGDGRPTWALRPGDIAGASSLADVAARMADAVRQAHPSGPLLLGGYSYGGVLAYEIAARLLRDGRSVERLVLLDSFAPASTVLQTALAAAEPAGMADSIAAMLMRGWRPTALLASVPAAPAEAERIVRLAEAVHAACADAPPVAEIAALIGQNLASIRRLRVLMREHVPDTAARMVPATLLRATLAPSPVGAKDPSAVAAFRSDGEADRGWSRWLAVPPTVIPVAADHFGLGEPAVLAQVAALLAAAPASPTAEADTRRRDRVLEVVRRHTVAVLDGVAPEAVTLAVSLTELGANSIDRVEIATLAMDELNANVPRHRLAGVSNLASLVDLLAEYAGTA
jgi:acyl transferase domain-containing protein/thioesterase domain-containing protein/SAM-dependent methyltransferase